MNVCGKYVYIHTMKYYSAIKKDEILSFVTIWMELGVIMLSEITQTQKSKYHMISLTCELKTLIPQKLRVEWW